MIPDTVDTQEAPATREATPTHESAPLLTTAEFLMTMDELLNQLRQAVIAKDSARASALATVIFQRLATEAAQLASTERIAQDLLLQLERPPGTGETMEPEDDLLVERSWGNEDDDSRENFTGDPAGATIPKDGVNYKDGVIYPVWFGTNRQVATIDEKPVPTKERSGTTTLGRVDVRIPKAHRFGETGSSFWKRLQRFDLRDDNLRMEKIEVLEHDAFFASLQSAMRLAKESGSAPEALLFLHGYNTDFEEAAIRAAQIGYDLRISGATAMFSWPSQGNIPAYPADEASIEASEAAIARFIVDFTRQCGAEKVHLIAHSMGNRGLLRAMQRIAAMAEPEGKIQFGQIFLAAPDVDRDLFIDLAHVYPRFSERTTLYASSGDKAVHASKVLHGAPRAGYFAPYTVVEGIDTVTVPYFDVDLLGHSYFAQAEALLHDIFDTIKRNVPPGQRLRLTAVLSKDGQHFWSLGK